MTLHVRQFGEVDDVLQDLAHDHDLNLNGLQRLRLLHSLGDAIHCAHVCPQLEVREDLDELVEVLGEQLEHALVGQLVALLRLFLVPQHSLNLLHSQEHDLRLVLIEEANQEELELLEESAPDDRLRGQKVLKVLHILLKSLLEELPRKRELTHELFSGIALEVVLFLQCRGVLDDRSNRLKRLPSNLLLHDDFEPRCD